MRRFALCCCAVALVACAKTETPPAKDSTAAAAAPAPAPLTYADIAGKWAMKTMAEGSDSVLVSYEMVAGKDSTGWSLTFPNRPAVPVRVLSMAGDSVVTEAGPYESVLRKGVKVSTHSVTRLKDGGLVGTTVAHYTVTGPDSLKNLHTAGTRVP